jgi:hypothetical protein
MVWWELCMLELRRGTLSWDTVFQVSLEYEWREAGPLQLARTRRRTKLQNRRMLSEDGSVDPSWRETLSLADAGAATLSTSSQLYRDFVLRVCPGAHCLSTLVGACEIGQLLHAFPVRLVVCLMKAR